MRGATGQRIRPSTVIPRYFARFRGRSSGRRFPDAGAAHSECGGAPRPTGSPHPCRRAGSIQRTRCRRQRPADQRGGSAGGAGTRSRFAPVGSRSPAAGRRRYRAPARASVRAHRGVRRCGAWLSIRLGRPAPSPPGPVEPPPQCAAPHPTGRNRASGCPQSHEEVIVSVADAGSGLPPDTHEQLFDRYHVTSDPERGGGLGLALVRQLVEAQGGRLWVASASTDGTEIAFSLPMAARLASAPPKDR